ncbi:uncharacterized protein AB675_10729 [Cyphellophora attinorum]|uniref:Uncharacterized protein n=1 Tax=Cyphellophora attinorum TaxID=1664694 RepID=A0A0N0NMZ1_9EURO|nr:uncharacterized protein AB675_10729 [Phialophora attinorum]KPI40908.1 hypothetical protein AB675_10729 [Phialophora attinorum]
MSSQPSTTTTTAQRPSVSLPPSNTTHLDPGAYIRGQHPITLGEHCLIHPRALLTTTTHPLVIGSNCVISEKAIIGGLPPSQSKSDTTSTTAPTTALTSPALGSISAPPTPDLASASQFTQPTFVSNNVTIHPHAQVTHSTTINAYTTIESHAVVYPGVTIGEHSKVCAGVHVRRDVPDWCAVWGNGNLRRLRRPSAAALESMVSIGASDEITDAKEGAKRQGLEDPEERAAEMRQKIEEAEVQRIRGVEKEREAATVLLRNAARAAVAAKRASVTARG